MNFDLFKEYEPLYVIGHKNPDVDSVVATILISNIFTSKGIQCHPCFLKADYQIDEYNKNIIDTCVTIDMMIIEPDNNYNFILVDHNDPTQSIGFGKRIVWGIDHHNSANILSNVLIGKICSCSLFIYDYFKNIYDFSTEEKFMIYMASLADSLFFKGSRCKDSDKELIVELGFDMDVDKLFHRYFIPTDLSQGLVNVIDNHSKSYNYRGIKFNSVVIKTYNEYSHLREEFINIINQKETFLGVWIDIDREMSYTYFRYNGKTKEIIYDFIASRGATIIPDIYRYIDKLLEV